MCILSSPQIGRRCTWGEDQAGHILGCHHVCIAGLLMSQSLFPEEVPRLQSSTKLQRSIGRLVNDVCTCRDVLRESARLAAPHAGCGGCGTNGDMIGMPIATIRSKGDDHIGTEGTNDFSHLSDQYFLVNVLQCPVPMV